VREEKESRKGPDIIYFSLEGNARTKFFSFIDADHQQTAASSGGPPGDTRNRPPPASPHEQRERGSDERDGVGGDDHDGARRVRVPSLAVPPAKMKLVAFKLLFRGESDQYQPAENVSAVHLPLEDFLNQDDPTHGGFYEGVIRNLVRTFLKTEYGAEPEMVQSVPCRIRCVSDVVIFHSPD
jgi:hypothetical protein